ncbi:STAS domain-containing protein [Alicyclobacillus acidoterrestris]|uniref:STAS domain-containing protein n=1 Tax=Alicyclobacillus TaxID=29330 RepID=UPI001A8FE4F6|nr:STAS domain-containing protein [Alicyclobacillus suci]
MDISVRVDKAFSSTVLAIVGEVDFPTVDQVLSLMDKHRLDNVVLDWSGISFIDSTGIGLILRAIMEIREAGGQITIVSIPTPIEQVLEEMGVMDIICEFMKENV